MRLHGHTTTDAPKGGQSLNIVIILAAVFVAAVLLLWAIARKGLSHLEQQDKIERLHELAESLRKDMRMNETAEQPLWGANLDRMERVVNILSNSTIDQSVITYIVCISQMNEEGRVLLDLRFVDESDLALQVNYCERKNSSDLGDVFATSQMLDTLTSRNTEVRMVFAGVKADNTLRDGSEPYSAQDYVDDMFPLFLVPEEMFKKIVTGHGQFILLDKQGNVLDRARLDDFDYGVRDKRIEATPM